MENKSEQAQNFSVKTWKEDLTLLVEGKRLHVAKNVLAYLSPVFDAMFSKNFCEKHKEEIELPGKEYESFLEFFRCFYPGSQKRITERNIFQVLPLADEYRVEPLITACEQFLRRYVMKRGRPIQDVLKCLAVSERYQMNAVKDICVNKIEDGQPTEIAAADIDPMCKDTVLEILKRVLVKQHFEKVKRFIHRGIDKEDYDGLFEDYTDAKGAIIDFTVENVSAAKTSESPPVTLWGIQFTALVKYTTDQGDNRMRFGLFISASPTTDNQVLTCRFKSRFVLKNSRSDDLSRLMEHVVTTEEDSAWGFDRFAEMSDILNPLKGFIKDNMVQIAIAFLANRPD